MRHGTCKRVCCGAVAGVAGSFLIQGMQNAGMRFFPAQMPPMRQHPGEYMVEKGEALLPARVREKIGEGVRKGAVQALGVGYGTTFAVLYALTRRRVRKVKVVADGSALGLVTWAAGYLGWLPATRLMPPITKQKPGQVVGAVASHLVFGMAAVAMYRALRRAFR